MLVADFRIFCVSLFVPFAAFVINDHIDLGISLGGQIFKKKIENFVDLLSCRKLCLGEIMNGLKTFTKFVKAFFELIIRGKLFNSKNTNWKHKLKSKHKFKLKEPVQQAQNCIDEIKIKKE